MSLIYNERKQSTQKNALLLGRESKGKSFAVKQEIRDILTLTEDKVVALDSEGDYASFAEEVGGKIIQIGIAPMKERKDEIYINPFDIVCPSLHEDILEEKTEYIIGFTEILMDWILTPLEIDIIRRACSLLYSDFIDDLKREQISYDFERNPTADDFCNILHSEPEPEAKKIAAAFEQLKPCHTNLNIDEDRFVVHNARWEMFLSLRMYTFFEYFLNTAKIQKWKSNKNPFHFYIDDMFPISEYPLAFSYMIYSWEKAEWWNIMFTSITQSVEYLLRSSGFSRYLVKNKPLLFLFAQRERDADSFAKLFHLSIIEQNQLRSKQCGTGVCINDERSHIFYVRGSNGD